MRVYIAAPMSKGWYPTLLRNACLAAAELMQSEPNIHPFIPHLYTQVDLVQPFDYERWMKLDFAFIEVCDVLLRLPGESPGADREVDFARKRGMIVFHRVVDVIKHYDMRFKPDTSTMKLDL